jgi:hypothetical protein
LPPYSLPTARHPGVTNASPEAGRLVAGVEPHQQLNLDEGLQPGRQTRGEVAFDAPEGELLLDYRSPVGEPLATFSIEG